jgi:hypothetical protein
VGGDRKGRVRKKGRKRKEAQKKERENDLLSICAVVILKTLN